MAAQAQPSSNITWQRTLGGSDYELPKIIKPLPDGGYITGGTTYSTDGDMAGNKGIADIFLAKLRVDGSVIWKRTYGGSNDDGLHSVVACADGGYLLAGYTKSANGDVIPGFHGVVDAWIVRLDANGNILWQKVIGGSDYDVVLDARQLADSQGSFILVGYTMSTNGDITHKIGGANNQDVWMLKLDSNGDVQWQKTFGGTDHDIGYTLEATYNGFVVCATSQSTNGQITNNKGQKDVWLYKTDYAGNLLWQYNYGGSGSEQGYDISPTLEGGWLLAGITDSKDGDFAGNHGASDAFLLKVDAQGKKLWSRCYGGTFHDQAQKAWVKPDGSIAMVAINESSNGDATGNYGAADYWALQLSATGNILWQQHFGGTSVDAAFAGCTATDAAQAIVMAGTTYSTDKDIANSMGNGDVWVIKVLPDAPVITLQPVDTAVCPSQTASFTLAANNADTYQWQQYQNNQWVNLSNNTVYEGALTASLLVKNVSGMHGRRFRCLLTNHISQTISNNVQLNLLNLPVITLQPVSVQTCWGSNVQLNAAATHATQLQWQQYTGTTWQNINGYNQATLKLTPAYNPQKPVTAYRLVAANACGTATSQTATVTVYDCTVPNAFSPNGDNIHDTWNLDFLNHFTGSTVEVFTRGGQKVYEQRGNATPWNGIVSGKPLPAGVYYYIIRIRQMQQELAGSLLIIR
jgi:gliding motility-associated-like protein